MDSAPPRTATEPCNHRNAQMANAERDLSNYARSLTYHVPGSLWFGRRMNDVVKTKERIADLKKQMKDDPVCGFCVEQKKRIAERDGKVVED